eukprot:gnl/Spiro4/16822_TR9055_c0_g1_i1.p1 gnl/Spiro4/16822_TR9055_c0_g1~~gnl/Spiro4/16822_TR9055_c0_g1_i1.p1  ORF type:complete len:484 (+),score=108.66 gnl/Spiro4/16822_TR9055_c0_g1_i1:134-1453(+)
MDPATKRTLVWVDPNQNEWNNYLMAQIDELKTERNLEVFRCNSTAEGLEAIARLNILNRLPETHFRIMSNNVREGDYQAGLRFAREVRNRHISSPILVFCGDTRRAEQALADSCHVILTNDTAFARQFALFENVSGIGTSRVNMIPDFSDPSLTERKEVLASEVQPRLDEACRRKRIANFPLEDLSDLTAPRYTKVYMPRTTVGSDTSSLLVRLLHHMSDIVYRFVRIEGTDQAPQIKRVIGIDNPRLQQRFMRNLDAAEAQLRDLPRPTYTPADQQLLNILEMNVPPIPEFRHARPCLLFHSTNDHAETVICSEGFLPQFIGGNTGNAGWYGRGVYFSTLPTYTSHYQPKRQATHRVGEVCFVVSWVILGRVFVQPTIAIGRAKEPNFDTHYAVTHQTRPIQREPGSRPDGDEIVAFNHEWILPLFVVEIDASPVHFG